MDETTDFAVIVLVVALALFLAILLRSLSARFAVPAAALFLVLPPIAAEMFPSLGNALSIVEVERITTVALILILFNGGLHIGCGASGPAARPDPLARGRRHVRDRGVARGRRALAARARLDARAG